MSCFSCRIEAKLVTGATQALRILTGCWDCAAVAPTIAAATQPISVGFNQRMDILRGFVGGFGLGSGSAALAPVAAQTQLIFRPKQPVWQVTRWSGRVLPDATAEHAI